MGIPTLLKLIDPHTTRPAHRKIGGCVSKFESGCILACNPDRRTREISEAHRIAQPPPRYGSTPSNARFDEDAAYLECDVTCNLYAQHARVFHFASGSFVYGVSVDVRINFYVGHEFGARVPVLPSSRFLFSVGCFSRLQTRQRELAYGVENGAPSKLHPFCDTGCRPGFAIS